MKLNGKSLIYHLPFTIYYLPFTIYSFTIYYLIVGLPFFPSVRRRRNIRRPSVLPIEGELEGVCFHFNFRNFSYVILNSSLLILNFKI